MLHKCSIWKVFLVFCKEPTQQHGLREVSKKANLSPTSTKIWLKRLLEDGMIIEDKKKYMANRENDKFIAEKMLSNLELLYYSGFVHELEKMSPSAAILFGSYRYGYDIEESDIDIAIIKKGKVNKDFSKYEEILHRNIHIIQKKCFDDFPEEIKSALVNGIVLVGRI